jgi:hypothetical protein
MLQVLPVGLTSIFVLRKFIQVQLCAWRVIAATLSLLKIVRVPVPSLALLDLVLPSTTIDQPNTPSIGSKQVWRFGPCQSRITLSTRLCTIEDPIGGLLLLCTQS